MLTIRGGPLGEQLIAYLDAAHIKSISVVWRGLQFLALLAIGARGGGDVEIGAEAGVS